MDLNSWTPRDVSRRVGWLVGFSLSSFVSAGLYFGGEASALVAVGVYLLLTPLVAGLVYLGFKAWYGPRFRGPRTGPLFKNVLEPPPDGPEERSRR